MFVFVLLAGCISPARPAEPAVDFGQQGSAASGEVAADSLLLEVAKSQRMVEAGSEQVFDFKLVNTGDAPLRAVISLAHVAGERWRTSLCVGPQCLLGDGSETTAADPLTLPPYLEQPFQVHVFVDPAARSGDAAEFALRVQPEAGAAQAESITLRAQVTGP